MAHFFPWVDADAELQQPRGLLVRASRTTRTAVLMDPVDDRPMRTPWLQSSVFGDLLFGLGVPMDQPRHAAPAPGRAATALTGDELPRVAGLRTAFFAALQSSPTGPTWPPMRWSKPRWREPASSGPAASRHARHRRHRARQRIGHDRLPTALPGGCLARISRAVFRRMFSPTGIGTSYGSPRSYIPSGGRCLSPMIR